MRKRRDKQVATGGTPDLAEVGCFPVILILSAAISLVALVIASFPTLRASQHAGSTLSLLHRYIARRVLYGLVALDVTCLTPPLSWGIQCGQCLGRDRGSRCLSPFEDITAKGYKVRLAVRQFPGALLRNDLVLHVEIPIQGVVMRIGLGRGPLSRSPS